MNNCLFTGNIAHDLELKKTDKGVSFVNFKLAVSKKYERKDGTKTEDVTFPEFEAWDSAAEFIVNNCTKGTRLIVESSLKERTVDQEDGTKRKYFKFRINNFEIARQPRRLETVAD